VTLGQETVTLGQEGASRSVTHPAIQAHRGSPHPPSGVAENTLEAFDRARRLGADGVELDVRFTADRVIAVHHDPEIPGLGAIAGLRAAELPDHVPTLAAALDACAGLMVTIEIKNRPGEPGFDPGNRLARDVAVLVADRGRAPGVVLSSFWPDALTAVHETRPEVPAALLVASWFDPGEIVPVALARHGAAIHPVAALVTAQLVTEARRAGLSIAAWTVNDRPGLERMAALGVDAVITDDVPLALDVRGRPS
jgi:glycerophosphoryl diester phosphodiesterase